MPKKISRLALLISLVALMAILITSLAAAQTGGAFDLTWSTIDGGGGSSSGGSYALSSTIGQSDASELSTGGSFTLNGGFWQSNTENTGSFYYVYLPLAVR